MPNFFAIYSSSSNISGDLFALEVAPPNGATGYHLTAALSELLQHTVMAEGLARQFGATKKGDQIDVGFRQSSHLTLKVHEFDPISVKVWHFADPRLGPNYFHLGMDDVERFFDVYRCDPPVNSFLPAMLFLQPLPHYRHWCRMLAPPTTTTP